MPPRTLRSSLTPLRYNVVSRARGQPPQIVASAGRNFLHPSRMAPSTARGAPAIQDAATTLDNVPSWDTSPNTFPQGPQYYQELLAWLPKQETRFTR